MSKMKKFMLFIFIINLGLATLVISGEPKLEWVACYEGPGNNGGYPLSMEVDNYGNVYVTGTSQAEGESPIADGGKDYITIKYDSNGRELWVARYDGSADSVDEAMALAIDKLGYVYVTGSSFSFSKLNTKVGSCKTIKYDPQGKEVWSVGPEGASSGLKIKIEASGRIRVVHASGVIWYESDGTKVKEIKTEFAPTFLGDGDNESIYITIGRGKYAKCDSQGNPIWTLDKYGSLYNMAVDSSDNLYVLGFFFELKIGLPSKRDHLDIIKYDANGKRLWSKRIDAKGQDILANYLKCDGQNNVYAIYSTNERRLVVLKFDPKGNKLWERISPSFLFDDAAIDEVGDIYIMGRSGSSYYDDELAIHKYNLQGKLVWSVNYDGKFGTPGAMVLDKHGNIYITGNGCYGINAEFITLKYSQKEPQEEKPDKETNKSTPEQQLFEQIDKKKTLTEQQKAYAKRSYKMMVKLYEKAEDPQKEQFMTTMEDFDVNIIMPDVCEKWGLDKKSGFTFEELIYIY